MTDSTKYALRWRGRQLGPFSIGEINLKLEDHELGMGHEILSENQWMTLQEFFSSRSACAAENSGSLFSAEDSSGQDSSVGTPVAPQPVAPARSFKDALRQRLSPTASSPSPPAPVIGGVRPASRLVFALLAIFLGFLGAHNFYARHWLTGLLQLLLSVATTLLGFGIIAPWLWAIVEALVVRRDGDGREMS